MKCKILLLFLFLSFVSIHGTTKIDATISIYNTGAYKTDVFNQSVKEKTIGKSEGHSSIIEDSIWNVYVLKDINQKNIPRKTKAKIPTPLLLLVSEQHFKQRLISFNNEINTLWIDQLSAANFSSSSAFLVMFQRKLSHPQAADKPPTSAIINKA